MKTIIQAMLEEIYENADKIAKDNKQAIHTPEKRGLYYITLEQLGEILKGFEG